MYVSVYVCVESYPRHHSPVRLKRYRIFDESQRPVFYGHIVGSKLCFQAVRKLVIIVYVLCTL